MLSMLDRPSFTLFGSTISSFFTHHGKSHEDEPMMLFDLSKLSSDGPRGPMPTTET